MKRINTYSRYSSKIKRVNVPLPSFEYIHLSRFSNKQNHAKPNTLIGRDRIIEKLKTWLTIKDTDGGTYLITGYRGMGKTSYVDRVMYELVAEPVFWKNALGVLLFFILITAISPYAINVKNGINGICAGVAVLALIVLLLIYKWYPIKEYFKKWTFCWKSSLQYLKKRNERKAFVKRMLLTCRIYKGINKKEWTRINNLINGVDERQKKYNNISISISLGQEILDERNVLCVLTSQLYDKYRTYILSPIANMKMWFIYTGIFICIFLLKINDILEFPHIDGIFAQLVNPCFDFFACGVMLYFAARHQLRILRQLHVLSKRIDATMQEQYSMDVRYSTAKGGMGETFSYDVAGTRDIESRLIAILDRINRYPIHPHFFFVFDELDKIEDPTRNKDSEKPEYSNERYLPSGGATRKRQAAVLRLLANMKFFTSTAKAKFIFIAGREMYDGYLADMTDRESAISSLFNGVIYVESFCKNEKSDRDVMYNTEMFIARQLLPFDYIESKVIDRLLECKFNGTTYANIDIDLKSYHEYLTTIYTENVLQSKIYRTDKERHDMLNDVRICIDKTINLLYHFSYYLYHVSNGSPKKMRLTFENLTRPLKDGKEFKLCADSVTVSPLDTDDIDIHIPANCKSLLSFGEKEQKVIGFIHYISFPVNQIFTNADQFGDKLLVSASFLINHIYKYHTGGFSWRNIEQTPELLEVYRIPGFRDFISSILNYLTQTHIIAIPCGLYQYKFRKQIAEEISLASKTSEEISAIFNFTLDESMSVKRHFEELKNNYRDKQDTKYAQPMAGIYHILADLHEADEEYNEAIFEYQAAIQELKKEDAGANDDPHRSSYMLAYIRLMLKLGVAYEKRHTYESAYNTYNEVIGQLIGFREFDQQLFGLQYAVVPTDQWPYYDALLYSHAYMQEEAENASPIRTKIVPKHIEESELSGGMRYRTKGSTMISDFSQQMTPSKHSVLQRLAMIEDTRIIYQALLAKLFITEKIELGGITRTNIDMIEGEFQYIHLTTNEREKFLISTDFYRRLGDIMFYKNGLVGFGFTPYGNTIEETFVDSLYYLAFDIRTELRSYCNQNECHERYEPMLKESRKLTRNTLQEIQTNRKWKYSDADDRQLNSSMTDFWKSNQINCKLKTIPLTEALQCKNRREKMWQQNKTLPCYACKFYNRSLRIMMTNLFDTEVEEIENGVKWCSKTIKILEQIVKGGSAKSMRQNYMIQLGEVLDCLGNTMLGCADIQKDHIESDFFARFLSDAHLINSNFDKRKDQLELRLLEEEYARHNFSRIETCILYYWEAFICFKYGSEPKKAAGSLKKILRVLQNYIRMSNAKEDEKSRLFDKVMIGEYLNEIKNRLLKQCLICLYTHYDHINIIEIQKLKWIMSAQMYENISLNRLSLFPDIEETMLIYYEMILLCIIDENDLAQANESMRQIRNSIRLYSRADTSDLHHTWDNISERNTEFTIKLQGIYNNISMGAMRHINSIYERMLSLRFKTKLNQFIFSLIFPRLKNAGKDITLSKIKYIENFCEYFRHCNDRSRSNPLWQGFFPTIDSTGSETYDIIRIRLELIEYLIRDSIYCLTYILETITPYTSTTLFTNSFMGSVHRDLNYWNVLLDSLFKYYKVFDDTYQEYERTGDVNIQRLKAYDRSLKGSCSQSCKHREMHHNPYLEQEKTEAYGKGQDIQLKWQSNCPYYAVNSCEYKQNNYDFDKQKVTRLIGKKENILRIGDLYRKIWGCNNVSDRFFESILGVINKQNNHYLLTNYTCEMAIKCFRTAKEIHREGKAYKEMIGKMFYLDDDLKNDTVQFDLAMERFKLNSGFIDRQINKMLRFFSNSIHDIESFCMDNETRLPLERRFPAREWNVEAGRKL